MGLCRTFGWTATAAVIGVCLIVTISSVALALSQGPKDSVMFTAAPIIIEYEGKNGPPGAGKEMYGYKVYNCRHTEVVRILQDIGLKAEYYEEGYRSDYQYIGVNQVLFRKFTMQPGSTTAVVEFAVAEQFDYDTKKKVQMLVNALHWH
jgi:hypothetical protein